MSKVSDFLDENVSDIKSMSDSHYDQVKSAMESYASIRAKEEAISFQVFLNDLLFKDPESLTDLNHEQLYTLFQQNKNK